MGQTASMCIHIPLAIVCAHMRGGPSMDELDVHTHVACHTSRVRIFSKERARPVCARYIGV